MTLLERGSQLEGKYEVLDRLEGGGMGEVYLVRHLHLEELRVIKLLRPDLADDPGAAERFHWEARTATQIQHPNVATLFDYSRLDDGRYFMVWEYIRGQDLASFLRTRGPLPVPEALELGIQTLRGLEAVHAAQVIHRDVSPENLMITSDHQQRPWVKIIDLGLAGSLNEPGRLAPQPGETGGKLLYCSPEQAGLLPGGLDARSDLYSFTLVLYQLITGELPFDPRVAMSLPDRFRTPPLPLRGRNPNVDVSEQLDLLVRKGLSYRREDRYPDASSMRLALLRALEPPRRPAPRAPSDMSPGERRRILADIERAARRVDESARLIGETDRAIKAGQFGTARELMTRLEEIDPRGLGLQEIRRRLADAEMHRARVQAMQAEEMVVQYVSERQIQLARAALDTLLELQPHHPGSAHFRERIEELEADERREKQTQEMVTAGRESLTRGDLAEARRQVERLEKGPDAGRAEALRQELEMSEREEQVALEVAQHKDRFEVQVAEARLSAADESIRALAGLGVPKAVLDVYRSRLASTSRQLQRENRGVELERQYAQALAAGHWQEAREIALELEAVLPTSSRPGEMFAETSDLEEADRRRSSVEVGTSTLEMLIDQGRLEEAEIAWKVLRDLEPKHPRRRKFEKRLRVLRKHASKE